MRNSVPQSRKKGRHDFTSTALALVVGLATLMAAGCEGRGAGAPCTSHSQCDDAYQCLQEICSPRCESNSLCGDGYQCSDKGICDLVISEIGDPCSSEWECGLGQSCVLERGDPDNDQLLESNCQAQGQGGNIGSECIKDEDCRNSLCSLGHCSQLCSTDVDCPDGNRCESIPRVVQGDAAFFTGCLQNTSVLSMSMTMDSPSERLYIPVPSSAESFSLVAKVAERSHLVGATKVVSPSGQLLFRESDSFGEFLANPIRYSRSNEVSTLMFPNDGIREIEAGIYEVDVEASLPPFGEGTAIPEVEVHYKLSESKILDLTFYFLNLEDHPCQDNIGVDTLNAASARQSDSFQDVYLGKLRSIFGAVDIQIATPINYKDRKDRPDLDAVTTEEGLRDLFRLADNEQGLAVFLVRSLPTDGVQTLGTSIPGPPRSPGTPSSGIAVSMDSLCYRDWESMARITAHSMAGQMGLWNNRDPEGVSDPIADSDTATDNLMFFGEFGGSGTELSTGQGRVLGLYPGLR